MMYLYMLVMGGTQKKLLSFSFFQVRTILFYNALKVEIAMKFVFLNAYAVKPFMLFISHNSKWVQAYILRHRFFD